MTGLPEPGDRVRIWPFPGARVQEGHAPVDARGGGRFLPSAGREVIWSSFHLEQLRGGAILLHPPPCEKHVFVSGADACVHCGRTMREAQTYDVHVGQGAPDPADAPVIDSSKSTSL